MVELRVCTFWGDCGSGTMNWSSISCSSHSEPVCSLYLEPEAESESAALAGAGGGTGGTIGQPSESELKSGDVGAGARGWRRRGLDDAFRLDMFEDRIEKVAGGGEEECAGD